MAKPSVRVAENEYAMPHSPSFLHAVEVSAPSALSPFDKLGAVGVVPSTSLFGVQLVKGGEVLESPLGESNVATPYRLLVYAACTLIV